MLIPSPSGGERLSGASLSRRVNANSQLYGYMAVAATKLIKKGEC